MKLKPQDHRIYSNIGAILYDINKYEDAVVNYLRSLEIEPENAEVLSNMGIALMKINLDYSSLTFEEALRLEPGNKKIINNYLMSLLVSKQFAKFTKTLSSVKKLLSEKEFEKYKALYHKFMKVSGIHQLELQQRMLPEGSKLKSRGGGPTTKKESPEGLLFLDQSIEEMKEEG
jgi:Flp pilus assembly protein TadD